MKISNFKFQIILPVLVVFAAGFVLWSNFNKPVSADWYNTLWQYRQKITIDKTKVGGGAENETNFPILVSITEPKLIKGAQSSGNDIMFTDSDGITKLSHEIESYNSSTGQLIAWVKVPTLTYQTNNVLYMYYGSASAPSQQNATDVWSNGFVGVWHLNETGTGAAGDYRDSKGTNNSTNTTSQPTVATGKITGGESFNGSTYIDMNNESNFDLNIFTLSLWAKPTAVNYGMVIDKWNNVNGNKTWYLGLKSDWKLDFTHSLNGNDGLNLVSNGVVTDSVWNKVDLVFSASSTKVIYINGSYDNSTVPGGIFNSNVALRLAGMQNYATSFPGTLDEVRISSTVRSVGWIATEYANQNSPSTFLTLSSTVEKSKAPVLYWKFDEGTGTVVNDSSVNKNNANLNSPVNLPTWQTEDMCFSGKCLYFEGSNASASATLTLPNVQTVSFWTKPASSSGTIPFVSFSNGTGTTSISSSDLAVATSGITSPTIYVNGKSSTTLVSNQWNHIEVTTGTSFTATNPVLGKIHTTFFKGYIDEFKIYDYQRTAAEVKSDYNSGSAKAILSPPVTSNGLVGHWKIDEFTGNPIDSSGNSITLTNNGTTTFVGGKFGNGGYFDVNTKYFSTTTAISGVKTIAFWIKPTANTSSIIDLNGTQTITATSGTISANNFTGATIYVNGSVSSTLTAGVWQHVVVTTNISFNSGTMTIGKVGSNSLNGILDDLRIFNLALSASDTRQLYNFYYGPVKYYQLEQTTNDATLNGNPIYAQGKFGSGLKLNGSGNSLQVPEATAIKSTVTTYSSTTTWTAPAGVTSVQVEAWGGGGNGGARNGGLGGDPGNGGGAGAYSKKNSVSVTPGNSYTVTVGTAAGDSWFSTSGTVLAKGGSNGAGGANPPQNAAGGQASAGIGDVKYSGGCGGSAGNRIGGGGGGSAYTTSDGGCGLGGWSGGGGGTGYANGGASNTNGSAPGGGGGGQNMNDGVSPGSGASGQIIMTYSGLGSIFTNQFSVSMWVNPTSSVVSKALAVNNSKIRMFTDANGYLNCQIYTSDWQTGAVGTTALPLNQWSHIACTYDKSNIKIYVNGISQGTTPSQTGTVNDSGNVWKFGQDAGGTYGDLIGTIDEVRLYNYAQTQKQIIADMNAGQATVGSPVGHQYIYYKFDEANGTTTKSSVAGGPVGTLRNGYSWNKSGKFGSAIDLNGLNGYVEVADNANLKYTGGDFSTSIWVNLTATDIDTSDIFSKPWNGSGDYNYRLQKNADNTLTFRLGGATTWTTATTTTISTGVWTHLAVTINSSTKEVRIYKNGSLMKSDTHTITSWAPPLGDSNLPLAIGTVYPYGAGWAGLTTHAFQGSMDEFKYYSSLLTPAEILVDYNRGASLTLGNAGVASQSAATAYCIPGDTSICSAPVAEWNFEEGSGGSVADTSGNGNTGTWTGTGKRWGQGKQGKAGVFNGSNDFVSVTHNSIFNITGDITFSTWFKPTSLSSDVTFLAKYDSGADIQPYNFLWTASTGKMGFYSTGGPGGRSCTNSSNLTVGRWYHLTWTITGTTLTCYTNGVSMGTATVATRPTNTSPITIGQTASVNWINGSLDQLRLYNYVRTPAQIAYDYNRGAPVGWWKMDECQGVVIHNSADPANGGIGTLTNATPGDCNTNASTAWYNGKTGKFNASLSFDGSDDYVVSANNSGISGNATFTISAWIKPNDLTNVQAIASFGDAVTSLAAGSIFINVNGNGSISSEFAGNNGARSASGAIGSTGQWYHLVITKSAGAINTTSALYVNGKSVAISSASSSTPNITNLNFVTGRFANSTYYFNGQIDDVQIYNYALTATQVKTLYNQNSAVRFGQ